MKHAKKEPNKRKAGPWVTTTTAHIRGLAARNWGHKECPPDYLAVTAPNVERLVGDGPLEAEERSGLLTPCRIHIHCVRKRLADADGISGKAVIDGLVHAKILPDDSTKYVEKFFSQSQEKGNAEVSYIILYNKDK